MRLADWAKEGAESMALVHAISYPTSWAQSADTDPLVFALVIEQVQVLGDPLVLLGISSYLQPAKFPQWMRHTGNTASVHGKSLKD